MLMFHFTTNNFYKNEHPITKEIIRKIPHAEKKFTALIL